MRTRWTYLVRVDLLVHRKHFVPEAFNHLGVIAIIRADVMHIDELHDKALRVLGYGGHVVE